MAQLTDYAPALRFQIAQLFQSANYCFATTTIHKPALQRRSPTFYFAMGGLPQLNNANLCGRLRTEHGHGALIDITTTSKTHTFYNTVIGRDAFHGLLPGTPNAAALAHLVAAQRTVPQANDFHHEFTNAPAHGQPYSRRHRSGGRIALAPQLQSSAQAISIVERILAEGGQIRLNNVVQAPIHAPGPAGPVAASQPNLALYIAGL